MDHDLDSAEMTRPVCPQADVTNRSNFGAGYRCRRAARYGKNIMAARRQATAQRIADEARGTGHQSARQARSSKPSACGRMAQAISAQMH
jgi:ribosomal protein L34